MTKKRRILQITALIILISGLGLSITDAGRYRTDEILGAEEYTLQVGAKNKSIDLKQGMEINNKYGFDPLPTINIDGSSFILAPQTMGAGKIKDERGSYPMSFEAERSGVKIHKDLSIEEDKIKLRTSITNRGGSSKIVSIKYSVSGPMENTVFYPSGVEKGTNRYAVLTNQNRKGLSLGVITNAEMNSSKAFVKERKLGINKKRKVSGGATVTLEVTLKPLNIWNSKDNLDFEAKYSSLLENSFIPTKGEIKLNVTGANAAEKTTEALNQLALNKEIGEGEFQKFTDPDLSKNKYNSLEATMAFKKTCMNEKIPCKVAVGEKESGKYAWIVSREDGKWVNIDPLKGAKQSPSGYEVTYVEPIPRYVEIKGASVDGNKLLSSTKFLLAMGGGISGIVYLIIMFIFIGSGGVALYWKSDFLVSYLQSLLEEEKEEEIEKKPLEGSYEIQIEKNDIKNKSIIPIFEKLVEENGEVDLKRYKEETDYSEEFISHCIRYMDTMGHIKLKGWGEKKKEIEEERKKRKEKKKLSVLRKVEGIAEKMSLTPTQLLLTLAVLAGGTVTIIVLLLLL